MTNQQALIDYLLRLGDNALILGQRLGEWCGHGPVLEHDIALSNMSLDHLGQARYLLTLAGEKEGKGRSEDDIAFLRDGWDFRNCLLVEQPNGDFAMTVARSFFYDSYNLPNFEALLNSNEKGLADIADKALKEVRYHFKYSSEWVLRLGDGTEESHTRMQEAIDQLWQYTGELTASNEVDEMMAKEGVAPDLDKIKLRWDDLVLPIIKEAGLSIPEDAYMQKGGKEGVHTEYLGHILTDLQFMQRAYPNSEW
mgnify:CR=1 FL=1